MNIKHNAETYLEYASRELEAARLAKNAHGEEQTLEFREFLVNLAKGYIAMAAELREREQTLDIEFQIARRKLLESVDT